MSNLGVGNGVDGRAEEGEPKLEGIGDHPTVTKDAVLHVRVLTIKTFPDRKSVV